MSGFATLVRAVTRQHRGAIFTPNRLYCLLFWNNSPFFLSLLEKNYGMCLSGSSVENPFAHCNHAGRQQ
jgi:hypothetical protein